MADKKLELQSHDFRDQPRLHEQKNSMVPRILKFQMKKKFTNVANFLNGPTGTNGYGYGAMISQR